jgi:thioredoxin-related protein
MNPMTARNLARSCLFAAAALVAGVLSTGIAQASELVMFEQGGCVWCAKWNREVAPIYQKTDEAKLLPLRRVDIDRQNSAGIALAGRVLYTPTFVVVDDGREIGRITGYSNDQSFWGLLDGLVAKLAPPPLPKI